MEQVQRRGMSMVFVLIVSAIFCAVATFVAITLVTNRSENLPPVGQGATNQVLVDDMLITLNVDPERAVVLIAQESVPFIPEQGAGVQPQSGDEVIVTEEAFATEVPPPTPVPEPVIFVAYTVRQGDSLYGIADAQNSSIELMALHGIDADDLVPGATLNLPVANPAFCPGHRAYVVRDKDTVFRIAAHFNTTKEAIRALNNLDENYSVRVTQVICVPSG
jgi:LysM repeat protein